jgi:cellulose synthase/poly-beta-1,6-N-acetylglucosamine synthase-like glycosyltransferase
MNFLIGPMLASRKTRKRITVGVPSFNEEQNILNLLQSIIQATRSEDPDNYFTNKDTGYDDDEFIISEIIISDDSSDSTSIIVDRFVKENPSLNIRLIHHPHRRGVSAAWNEIFQEAIGEIIVLYDADIIIDKNSTRELVSSIKENVGLCASNSRPFIPKEKEDKKLAVLRASIFIANWLKSVRRTGLSQYTVMGRALSISSDVAKKITVPENIIALDLYVQCRTLEEGFDVIYNEDAIVYFKPPDNMIDFASQIIRATNGHKQIQHYISRLKLCIPLSTAFIEAIQNIISDPKGAISLIFCYMFLPYYKLRLRGEVDSAKWHIAKSTKAA